MRVGANQVTGPTSHLTLELTSLMASKERARS